MSQRATRIGLASALFLISGFAALVYQVIWQRILGIFSGAHIYSITLIVTAFMAGLGFGSLIGGRWADRLSRRSAVLAFAGCECVIGLFALVSPWLYYDVAYLKLGFLVRYTAVLPLVHFVLLLVPTFLMGASLPLLSRGIVEGLAGAARTIGVLYGVNALGAALGAFVSAWYLVGTFGFVGTVRMAAVLNLLACAGALVVRAGLRDDGAPGIDPGQDAPAEPMPAGAGPAMGLAGWATLYGLSGFVALSLEILWFRVLNTAIKSSPYSFGHLLGVFLLFLAVGSLVGAFTVHRSARPDRVFLWGQFGIALSAGLAFLVLTRWPAQAWPLAGLHEYWTSDAGIPMERILAAWRGADGADPEVLPNVFRIYLALPLSLLAVPTFLMGWTYAYVQRTVQTDARAVGWRVGVIQTANIVGSMLGSFLTGALFLSVFGTPLTLRLLVLVAVVFGVLAVVRSGGTVVGVAAVGGLAVLVALALPGERVFWARLHGTPLSELLVVEDASSVVALQRRSPRQAVLRVNGTGMSLLPYGGAWTVLGLVPPLVHPDPAAILHIGLGAGNTAWAAAAVPSVERLDVYEIAKPEIDVVLLAQEQWGANPAVAQLVEDPRVHMTFSDGRLAMRLEPRRYDIIEADALEPHMAYSGNLYSVEFFRLIRDSLNPGGFLCTYVPTERVKRTVAAVFPHALIVESAVSPFMLAGDAPVTFDKEQIRRRFEDPRLQAWLRASGQAEQAAREIEVFLRTARVTVLTPRDRRGLDAGDVNTDLFPRDEYAAHQSQPQ